MYNWIKRQRFVLTAFVIVIIFLVNFAGHAFSRASFETDEGGEVVASAPARQIPLVRMEAKKPVIALAAMNAPAPMALESTNSGDGTGAANSSGEETVQRRTLAYHHSITFQFANGTDLKAAHQKAQQACMDAPQQCVLLGSNLATSGGQPTGNLSLRLQPAAVKNFIARAGDGSEKELSRSTDAEDLASQITDMARRRAMYEMQFAQLQKLYQRPNDRLRDVIELAQEISRVQTQLEFLKAEETRVDERVNWEAVDIEFTMPPTIAAAGNPLWQAWSKLGLTLATSTASLLIFIAGTLPWLISLLLVLYVVRGLMLGRWGFRKPELKA
jgi:hypothetical protein